MGALLGTGTPSVYPSQQIPWGFNPQLSGLSGATVPFGAHVPQQLQQLQAAVHQLLQNGFVQQQQIQQLLQIVPQQLQQIHQLIQFVAQHAQSYPYQSFLQNAGYPVPSFGAPSPWLGSSPGTQTQLFGGQGAFGTQGGYVM